MGDHVGISAAVRFDIRQKRLQVRETSGSHQETSVWVYGASNAF